MCIQDLKIYLHNLDFKILEGHKKNQVSGLSSDGFDDGGGK